MRTFPCASLARLGRCRARDQTGRCRGVRWKTDAIRLSSISPSPARSAYADLWPLLVLAFDAIRRSSRASRRSPEEVLHRTCTSSTCKERRSASGNRTASLAVVASSAPRSRASRCSWRSVDAERGAWSGKGRSAHTLQPIARSVWKKRRGRAVPLKARTRRPRNRLTDVASGCTTARSTGRLGGSGRSARTCSSVGGLCTRMPSAVAGGARATSAPALDSARANGSRSGPAGRTKPLPSR
mmetsp:Transcript_40447/g.94405  ORF Transcript_40447/g.94405 Transcript_40447/m.94405 type:complete len:241 (-) Transcript_40447:537-1259(-)